jgi:hypothetical protein
VGIDPLPRGSFRIKFLASTNFTNARVTPNSTRLPVKRLTISAAGDDRTDRNITMTMKNAAFATLVALLGVFSGMAYAATATPQIKHRMERASASQIPPEVSRAYDSATATEDRGPHYHGGPKIND